MHKPVVVNYDVPYADGRSNMVYLVDQLVPADALRWRGEADEHDQSSAGHVPGRPKREAMTSRPPRSGRRPGSRSSPEALPRLSACTRGTHRCAIGRVVRVGPAAGPDGDHPRSLT
jgi:hypothetical protein